MLSSKPDEVSPVLIDDAVAIVNSGVDYFTYLFDLGGNPPLVEIPYDIMNQLTGQAITVEYRDVFADVVSATSVWLICEPK